MSLTSQIVIVYRQPFYFWPFYKFVEPFLPAEIRDKVVFAANLDELLQYVDAEHLPEDMGGKAAAKGYASCKELAVSVN